MNGIDDISQEGICTSRLRYLGTALSHGLRCYKDARGAVAAQRPRQGGLELWSMRTPLLQGV